MSRLDVNTLRHTAGSADNITLDNSQNVTIEGNLTVDGSDNLVNRNISGESAEVQGICNAVWTTAVKNAWKAKLISDKPS